MVSKRSYLYPDGKIRDKAFYELSSEELEEALKFRKLSKKEILKLRFEDFARSFRWTTSGFEYFLAFVLLAPVVGVMLVLDKLKGKKQ